MKCQEEMIEAMQEGFQNQMCNKIQVEMQGIKDCLMNIENAVYEVDSNLKDILDNENEQSLIAKVDDIGDEGCDYLSKVRDAEENLEEDEEYETEGETVPREEHNSYNQEMKRFRNPVVSLKRMFQDNIS
jgi:hypothetical protein